MSKLQNTFFLIPIEIYGFDIMVSIDEPDDKLRNRLIKYGSTYEDCEELMNLSETVRGRCVMLPSNQTVIRLKVLLSKYEMMGVIAHEVFHATTFLLHKIGIKFDLNVSDEVYAYLLGYITTEIYKKIKI